MKRVNVAEAKTHLSALLREVKNGETFVICERNVPVAEVRAFGPVREASPQFGTLRGEIQIAEDAFAPLTDDERREWERPLFGTEA